MPDPGGGLGACPPPKEAVLIFFCALYDIASIYSNVLGRFGGGFGCFNGQHDGYANS